MDTTDQYVANYSMAGRLQATSADTDEGSDLVATDFLRWNVYTEVPDAGLSPGYLRFGRGEGCGFVEGNAREWSDRYLCTTNNDYGCSFDNRMSAVCTLRAAVTVPQVRDTHCLCRHPLAFGTGSPHWTTILHRFVCKTLALHWLLTWLRTA